MRTLHLALALALSVSAPAWAQTSTTAPPRAKLPPGFEPVPGGAARAEAVDANTLVVAAYAAFFAGMFGYLVYVARRQAALGREVAELQRKLEKKP